MATPLHHLPNPVLSAPLDESTSNTPDLDDVFFPMLAKLALVPIRRGGDTVKGLVRDNGLTAATLRALAIRWCQAEEGRSRFSRDELRGLELALIHYSNAEFREMIEGAIIAYGVKVL